jgi:hypothetical protein
MATFTIQDSSNVEEETYYRSPGQQGPASPTALEGSVNYANLDSLMTDIGQIVGKDGSDASKVTASGGSKSLEKKSDTNELMRIPKDQESRSPLNGLSIDSESVGCSHVFFSSVNIKVNPTETREPGGVYI